MNKKYERYINYIVNELETPFFINMRDNYGLKDNEYSLVLSKVFNQPVTIRDNSVNDTNGNKIYYEESNGYWVKYEYDNQGNIIYSEYSDGYWVKYEYDNQGNIIYSEYSDGEWFKYKYDTNGNLNYREDSNGDIIDNL